MQKKDNGFAIINKSTGESMCPAYPNEPHNMIYTQDHEKNNHSLFQPCDKEEQVILSESANDLKQTCYFK